MKVSLTHGKAEGPTKLNSFDNALLDAGIGDVNLIKVSSILSPSTKVVELPDLPKGAMINCVLAHAFSDNPGDIITAVIAVAMGDDLGCVVENTGINRDSKEIEKEATLMAEYMMDVRGLKMKKSIIRSVSHQVIDRGSVVAAVIYLEGCE